MGKPMAGHILKKGHTLGVFNRTASKADDLVKEGATFKTPQELAAESDILFLMLAYPHDVESMVFDHENGILKHMKPGSILVDHTTSTPSLAMKIAEEAKARNV